MTMEIYFQLHNKKYLFRELRLDGETQVMNLFNRCEDYFYLIEGRAAVDCEEFFHDLPPGKDIEDKYLYGIYEDQFLIGVVDIVKNYPEEGEWIIGLMLLDPKTRGKGLGKAIHNILIEIARGNKGEKLRIGVLEQNIHALKFWQRIGYKEIKRTEPRRFGMKDSIVIVLNYFL